ncbi:MAG: response regulator [Sinimarinibacterium sp.]|jgi:CheY-like chemotaxis protein
MNELSPPTILCVDDEPQLLASLELYLRKRYRVLTAASGAEGIRLLRARPEIDVVVSDMRMPGMDGAKFLHAARSIVPDVPRLLLTGHADVDAAIAAVNEGQIFRFLVKPCPPLTVIAALEAAVQLRRLVSAERVLLQQTLTGAVQALINVLALRQPLAFGSSERVKRLAGDIAARLVPELRWAVEIAAMLTPLGMIALPDEVAEKIHAGRPLDAHEQAMVERMPTLTDSLIGHIPRLETVRALLAMVAGAPMPAFCMPSDERLPAVRRAAAILRTALDFDALRSQGFSAHAVLGALQARADRYDGEVMTTLTTVCGDGPSGERLQEIPAGALRAGMVIARDVVLANGVLLVARGYEVTQGLVERVRNLRPGALTAPIFVLTAAAEAPRENPESSGPE